MNDFFTLKHSFNAGDCIVLLPGLQHLYNTTRKKTIFYQRIGLPAFYYDGAQHPVKMEDGTPTCMNNEMWAMLKPLLEAQEYIEKAEVWQGESVDFDIDLSRDSKTIPMPAGAIHQYASSIYPELSCDLSERWLSSDFYFWHKRYDYKDKIIINRTQRYTNPYITYFFLKEHQDNIIFSGTGEEHKLFCGMWGLSIPLLMASDFLELARIISCCKFYIGNQSLGWHLADSQKVNRVLELCPQFPNTFVTGANGYQFYHQKSLEYYFNKLMNE